MKWIKVGRVVGKEQILYNGWPSCRFVGKYWITIREEIKLITNITIPHLPETYLLGSLPNKITIRTALETIQLFLAIARITMAASWKNTVVAYSGGVEKETMSLFCIREYTKIE